MPYTCAGASIRRLEGVGILKILFDHPYGELMVRPVDGKVKEYVEALIMLGFEPRVEMED
jgi:hypothetical protein